MACGRSLMKLKKLLQIQDPNVQFIPGKVEALMIDLEKNGQKEPVILYRDPRFKEELLNRIEAARRLGWKVLKIKIEE